jgi:hypothetical protein
MHSLFFIIVIIKKPKTLQIECFRLIKARDGATIESR